MYQDNEFICVGGRRSGKSSFLVDRVFKDADNFPEENIIVLTRNREMAKNLAEDAWRKFWNSELPCEFNKGPLFK